MKKKLPKCTCDITEGILTRSPDCPSHGTDKCKLDMLEKGECEHGVRHI